MIGWMSCGQVGTLNAFETFASICLPPFLLAQLMYTADATLTVQKVALLTIPMEPSVRFAPGLMTLPLVMQSRVELDPVVPLVQPTSGTSTVPTELHVQGRNRFSEWCKPRLDGNEHSSFLHL